MTSLFSEPFADSILPVAGVAKRLLLLARAWRLHSARIVGPDGEAVYAGEGGSLAWLAQLHQARVEERRPIGLLGLLRMAAERKTLCYIEINRLFRPLLPPRPFFTLPWIRFVADLEREATTAAMKEVETTYGRKVRQQGFKVRLETGLAAAEEFYRGFYLPYLRWRFGDEAHPRSQAEIVSAVRRGFLLQILDGAQPVSATVCRRHDSSVTMVASGLRGDYRSLLRRGAMSALYCEVFRWARANHLRHVDLLRARPHADDGVSQHKKRFGAQPETDPWPHALLAIYPPRGLPLPRPAHNLLVENDKSELAPLAGLAEISAARESSFPSSPARTREKMDV